MNAALVISERDNVATALESLEPGRALDLGAVRVVVAEPVPRGHKIALRAIAHGEPVVKYGSAIGTATLDIAAGAHVHTHNVSSARGRGDLAGAAPNGDAAAVEAPRIAEPPDAATAPPVDDATPQVPR